MEEKNNKKKKENKEESKQAKEQEKEIKQNKNKAKEKNKKYSKKEKNAKENITEEKENNKKQKLIKILLIILVIVIFAIIAYFMLTTKPDKELKPAPDIEIDYSELEVERDDGQINMTDTEFAKIKDGVKRNNSEKVKEEKEFNSLKILDGSIEASGGMSQFIAVVQNPYDKKIEEQIVKVVFVNQDGSQIAEIESVIPELEPKSENTINIVTELDITNAYDYYIQR